MAYIVSPSIGVLNAGNSKIIEITLLNDVFR